MLSGKTSREERVLTLGETMLRLAPLIAGERLVNAVQFRIEPGGSESNVAILLAHLGHNVYHLTKVPDNSLGEIVIRYLRGAGVEVEFVHRSPGRLGCYWTEIGNGTRPPKVIYDREGSLFSSWAATEVAWNSTFKDVHWFHSSGVTPAISEAAADFLAEALNSAPIKTTLSIDLNYRNTLWTYIRKNRRIRLREIMSGLCSKCDYVFGNETDFQDCLGIRPPQNANVTERFQGMAAQFFKMFPLASGMAVSLRISHNASENTWSGFLFLKNEDCFATYHGPVFQVKDIVDRLGVGDSFSGGIIHGLTRFKDRPQDVIDFATALGAFKHSILGDACSVSESEIRGVLRSKGSATIIR